MENNKESLVRTVNWKTQKESLVRIQDTMMRIWEEQSIGRHNDESLAKTINKKIQ